MNILLRRNLSLYDKFDIGIRYISWKKYSILVVDCYTCTSSHSIGSDVSCMESLPYTSLGQFIIVYKNKFFSVRRYTVWAEIFLFSHHVSVIFASLSKAPTKYSCSQLFYMNLLAKWPQAPMQSYILQVLKTVPTLDFAVSLCFIGTFTHNNVILRSM